MVDDPSNPEKSELIKTALQTKKIIFAVGIKEDIEAFINQSTDQIEIFKLVSAILFESSKIPESNRVLFCMEGEYMEYITVPEDIAGEIVKRIKSMANLDVEDSSLPKIGFIKFQWDDSPEFRITVIIYPNDGLREVVDLKI